MQYDAGVVSVLIPANNEEALIGSCLSALALSHWPHDADVEIIVVANGCTDDTAAAARLVASNFDHRGWRLNVIEDPRGSKLIALNTADQAARGAIRIYLDADVEVGRDLIAQLTDALGTDTPRYASGRLLMEATGTVSRAYARIWRKMPFMTQGVPGCGLFAMNAAGRNRWGAFPEDIISDDTFARLHFAPDERVGTTAAYRWPIAEGWGALVKVRRRQNIGVDEIRARYPDLMRNDDTAPLSRAQTARMALSDPLGFAVFAGVAIACRLTRHRARGWTRGR